MFILLRLVKNCCTVLHSVKDNFKLSVMFMVFGKTEDIVSLSEVTINRFWLVNVVLHSLAVFFLVVRCYAVV